MLSYYTIIFERKLGKDDLSFRIFIKTPPYNTFGAIWDKQISFYTFAKKTIL